MIWCKKWWKKFSYDQHVRNVILRENLSSETIYLCFSIFPFLNFRDKNFFVLFLLFYWLLKHFCSKKFSRANFIFCQKIKLEIFLHELWVILLQPFSIQMSKTVVLKNNQRNRKFQNSHVQKNNIWSDHSK